MRFHSHISKTSLKHVLGSAEMNSLMKKLSHAGQHTGRKVVFFFIIEILFMSLLADSHSLSLDYVTVNVLGSDNIKIMWFSDGEDDHRGGLSDK